MTSPQRNKGNAYERLVVTFLRECGFRVDRTRAGWTDDRGDVHGLVGPDGKPFVIECKNHKTLALAAWVAELGVECSNAGAEVGAVVHKRTGSVAGQEQYATLPLRMLVQLLKQAGYK